MTSFKSTKIVERERTRQRKPGKGKISLLCKDGDKRKNNNKKAL
jgi:hypothetical protein